MFWGSSNFFFIVLRWECSPEDSEIWFYEDVVWFSNVGKFLFSILEIIDILENIANRMLWTKPSDDHFARWPSIYKLCSYQNCFLRSSIQKFGFVLKRWHIFSPMTSASLHTFFLGATLSTYFTNPLSLRFNEQPNLINHTSQISLTSLLSSLFRLPLFWAMLSSSLNWNLTYSSFSNSISALPLLPVLGRIYYSFVFLAVFLPESYRVC